MATSKAGAEQRDVRHETKSQQICFINQRATDMATCYSLSQVAMRNAICSKNNCAGPARVCPHCITAGRAGKKEFKGKTFVIKGGDACADHKGMSKQVLEDPSKRLLPKVTTEEDFLEMDKKRAKLGHESPVQKKNEPVITVKNGSAGDNGDRAIKKTIEEAKGEVVELPMSTEIKKEVAVALAGSTIAKTDSEPIIIGQVVLIIWSEIMPFEYNPRKHKSPEELQDLENSIREKGQRAEVWLREIEDPKYKYELIEGERRWLACGRISQTYLMKAIILQVENGREHYELSCLANSNRIDLCDLDYVEMVRRLKEYGNNEDQIMAITGKKISWVKQHLAVALKANPKIIEMLSPELPEYKRLTFSAVYALSMVPDRQRQLEVAETAVTLGWTVAKIRRVIEGERVKSGRRRKPSDEFSVFEGFIHRTNRYLEDFCVHHPELLGRMFTFRPPQDSRKVCEAINSIMAHFNKMKGIISLKIEQQEERD